MKSDANKGITNIEYNYLKLPKRVVQNGVTTLYQYSAIGTQVTDDVGNIIYKNGVLYQIGHDEGRVVNGVYEYDIRDHLGSLRVSFKDSVGIAKITQANSYGIFGEELPSLSYQNTPNLNNYKFTDKENLPETGYTDFGARFYDNLVPRFTTIDPLAENDGMFSPFIYAFGNPVSFIDPDGMWPTRKMVDGGGGIRSRYGVRTHPVTGRQKGHMGLDITASTGQNVHAAADGKVTKVGYQFNGTTGWGWYITIRHKNGYTTRYAHLKSKDDINVKAGDKITDGQIIALSGESGGVTGPHLHFEVMKKGSHIDPESIDNLQDQIGIEESNKQIITPVQMTLGSSTMPNPLLNLPRLNSNNIFPSGPLLFVNQQPVQPAEETNKKSKSTSTPVTGATNSQNN